MKKLDHYKYFYYIQKMSEKTYYEKKQRSDFKYSKKILS